MMKKKSPLYLMPLFLFAFTSLSRANDQELKIASSQRHMIQLEKENANFWVNVINANQKQSLGQSVYMTPQGTIDKDSFSNYFKDGCDEKKLLISNENELRKLGMRRCKDSTVSFVQPDSTGFNGYEGKCGQTAASNIMYAYCKLIVSPANYADNYLSDYTPGVRPGTLTSGLENMFNINTECPRSGSWYGFSYDYEQDYISAIKRGLNTKLSSKYQQTRQTGLITSKKVTPVALLIRVPGGQELHWITIVDIEESKKSCDLIVNHWDGQYKVPCAKIAKWSRGVADSYGLVLNKYYVIKYM